VISRIRNLRVRSNTSGIDIVAFDWGNGRLRHPGRPDVAECSGRGRSPGRRNDGSLPESELVEYWEVVRESWSDLGLARHQRTSRNSAAVFRSLLAISLESEDIGRGWVANRSAARLSSLIWAVALQHLGFPLVNGLVRDKWQPVRGVIST